MGKRTVVQPETAEADGNADAQAAAAEYASYAKDEVIWLPRELIHPDPKQIRKRFVGIGELRESIRTSGLLQDLAVRPHPEIADHWQLVSGERRWRAAEGLDRVREDAPEGCLPCKIDLSASDALEHKIQQYLFNAGTPVTPVEEGLYYEDLMREHGLSEVQIAKRLGVPRSSIGDRRRLAQLAPEWLELLNGGQLTVSQAIKVTRYRGLHANAQRGAVAALLGEVGRYRETLADMSIQSFGWALERAVRDQIFPLDGTAPYSMTPLRAAQVREHDDACGCGRTTQEFDGRKNVVCCSNPEWWQPAVAVAKKERAAKEADAAARKLAKRETSIALPAATDTPVVPWDGFGKPPKGALILTEADGDAHRWATDTWGRLAFDPDDVVFEPTKLGRWASPHGAREGVLTTDFAAIKAANARWNERWTAREAEIAAEVNALVHGQLASFPLSASSAPVVRQLLLAICDQAVGQGDGNLISAAELAGIPVPDEIRTMVESGRYDREDAIKTWIRGMDDGAVAKLAQIYALIGTMEIQPVAERVGREQEDALKEIGYRKTPWGEAPPQPEKCVDCGNVFDPDDLDEETRLCWECREKRAEHLDEAALDDAEDDDVEDVDVEDVESDDEAAVGAGGGGSDPLQCSGAHGFNSRRT